MLRCYVEKLLSLDPLSLQKIAYLNESQAQLLSSEQKHSLMLQAAACGKSMAESLRQKYGICDVERLVSLCGGNIQKLYEPPEEEYALFAYFEKPDNITINTANIKKSEQLIIEYHLESLIGEISLQDLLLSHELYHLLESRVGKTSFVRQRHACFFRLGKLKLLRKVGCLEEIAAMSFASDMLKLKCSPYIFNIIMLYAFHPQKAARVMADYTGNEDHL